MTLIAVSLAQTSSAVAPGFRRCTRPRNDSDAYTAPLGATAMSLQMPPAGGNGYVPFAAPVFRSNDRSAVCPTTGAPPWPPVEFWQAHSVLLFSSASTPSTRVRPVLEARIQGSPRDAPGAAHLIPFFDAAEIAEKYGADLIFFEVEGDTHRVRPEFNQFAGHDVFEPVQPGDTIAHANDGHGFRYIYNCIKIFNLALKYTRDFVCSDLSHTLPSNSLMRREALAHTFQLAAQTRVVLPRRDMCSHACD